MERNAFNKKLAALGERLIVRASDKLMKDKYGYSRKGDVYLPDDITAANPGFDKYIKRDLAEIRPRIERAFHAWFHMCDPTAFDEPISEMREAVTRLNRNVSVSGKVGKNHKLEDLDFVVDELVKLEGGAVLNFRRHYAGPVRGIIDGQRGVATILGTVLVAEQRIFMAAQHDVISIMNAAIKAMEPEDDSVSASTLLKIAGAVAGVAGVFVGGPAGTVVAVGLLGQGIGAAKDFLPDEAASKGSPGEIKGKHWQDVMEDVERELTRLSTAIERREKRLAEQCNGTRAFVNGDRRSFDLAAPSDVLNATAPGRLGAKGAEIRSDLTTLRRIGRIYSEEITHELVYASNRLTDAIDEGAWTRNSRVGHSAQGAYPAWRALNDMLREIVDDTKWEVNKAGEHLVIAGELLERGDGDAAVGLARTQRALERHHDSVRGGSPASHKDYARSPR